MKIYKARVFIDGRKSIASHFIEGMLKGAYPDGEDIEIEELK